MNHCACCWGPDQQLPNFYHAVDVLTYATGRGGEICTAGEIPGYVYEKRAPTLRVGMGPPEWLIRP